MVAADDDGRLELAGAHHLVEGQSGAVALAQADPADARRQALEGDALAGHVEPAVQVRVAGKSSFILRSVRVYSSGSPDSADPAERPLAAAKERADVGRHETREGERVGDALVQRHLADVVAVVECRHAHAWKSSIACTCTAQACAAAASWRAAGIGLRGASSAPRVQPAGR